MNKVAHFVRKNTQLRSSFIRNQITSHAAYDPVVVWRRHISDPSAGYASFDFSAYPGLNLHEGESWREKALWTGPKMLSAAQVKKTAAFLDEQKVRVCHFHYGSDCGVFFPLLRKVNIPAVVSFYGYDCSSFPQLYFGYGKTYLRQRVFRDVSAVLAMSPDMKKDLMRAGCPEEKIIVHYYGTDTGRFYMERDYPRRDSVTLLILAMLVPQKGHLTLLKSIKKLVASGVTDFTLRIVGGGELDNQLRTYVRENGLDQYVVFTGPIQYASEEMMTEYREADIFVHPSVQAANGDKEGIPGTIIEAMSAGLPVVSTHHAGIPYIMEDDQTGRLVPEYDENALAEAIGQLIADRSRRERIGRAAQRYACDHLELSVKELELEKIYEQVIHSGAAVKMA